jgi:hypothetical protein
MTPQEQQLIDGLVERIRNTPAAGKDDDADRYLHQSLDTVPDALYVLAQTVLVQQYGLENAKSQLAQAQEQINDLQGQLDRAHAQQPQKSGSFLSHLLGTDNPPQQPPPYQPVNTGYPPQQPYGAPVYTQPVYSQPVGYGMGGGGFLRGALQTAAGVAAGEMMFQGMESLFHGFGAGHEYGGGGEILNNNYYGDEGREHHAEASTGSDSGFYNPSDDASRDNFADDNNSNDDAGYDDSGSFDDTGSSGGDDSSF